MIDGKIKWDENSRTPALSLPEPPSPRQEIERRYMFPRLKSHRKHKGDSSRPLSMRRLGETHLVIAGIFS